MTLSDVKQLAISRGMLSPAPGNLGKKELKYLRSLGFHTYPLRPLSYSSLKEFRKSPLHYIEYLTGPRMTTQPMIEGKVFEAVLFGRDLEEEFVVFERPEPEKDFRYKANQTARKEARAKAAATRRDVIERPDLERIQLAVRAALRHPFMKHMQRYRFRQPREKVIIDKRSGLKLLGMADLSYKRGKVGVDIKFVQSVADFEQHIFGRTYQYWLQAAMYSLVYGYEEFYFFATQKRDYHYAQAFYLDKERLAVLREYLVMQVLMKFRLHLAKGFFGYAEPVRLPHWVGD